MIFLEVDFQRSFERNCWIYCFLCLDSGLRLFVELAVDMDFGKEVGKEADMGVDMVGAGVGVAYF